MDIAKIDRNFIIETNLKEADIVWRDAAAEPFRLYGACPEAEGPFYRLPQSVAGTINGGVWGLCRHCAGIRLRFATNSPYIAIKAAWDSLSRMEHFPLTGSSAFDLFTCVDGKQTFVNGFRCSFNSNNGYESILYPSSGDMKEYVLDFPLYNAVDSLYIGLKEGSTLTAGTETYHNDKPVVFYGSSITQGGCASVPGNSYQGFLSRALNMDYINLGFSGSCHGEPAAAEYMAGLDMSVFVCDYDHNAPSADELRANHYNLYKTIRTAHPDLPYVIVTRPHRADTPDGRERFTVIMDTYMRAIAEGDTHVYFVDGNGFFPADLGLSCTVDGCHPTDLGFYFMAQTLEKVLKPLLYR